MPTHGEAAPVQPRLRPRGGILHKALSNRERSLCSQGEDGMRSAGVAGDSQVDSSVRSDGKVRSQQQRAQLSHPTHRRQRPSSGHLCSLLAKVPEPWGRGPGSVPVVPPTCGEHFHPRPLPVAVQLVSTGDPPASGPKYTVVSGFLMAHGRCHPLLSVSFRDGEQSGSIEAQCPPPESPRTNPTVRVNFQATLKKICSYAMGDGVRTQSPWQEQRQAEATPG